MSPLLAFFFSAAAAAAGDEGTRCGLHADRAMPPPVPALALCGCLVGVVVSPDPTLGIMGHRGFPLDREPSSCSDARHRHHDFSLINHFRPPVTLQRGLHILDTKTHPVGRIFAPQNTPKLVWQSVQ